MAKQAQCDVCGVVQSLDKLGGLPAGWLTACEREPAKFSDWTVAGEAVEVCGLECLGTFAKAEQTRREEASGVAALERVANGGEGGHVRASQADSSDE